MKKHFFCDETRVENFDKKCLTLSKENQKSPFIELWHHFENHYLQTSEKG
jgi:hypothetical protein